MDDESEGLRPGDVVYLDLSVVSIEAVGELREVQVNSPKIPLVSGQTVLIGSGWTTGALEESLIGKWIGDTGSIEAIRTEDSWQSAPPTGLKDETPERVVDILREVGIETAWDFLSADPQELAEAFMLDAEKLESLQTELGMQLDGRRLLRYEIVDAYRWVERDTDGRPTDIT